MKPLPMRLGDLSVGFVHSLADAVRSHAADPLPLLEQYGLTPRDWPRPGRACRFRAICAWATQRFS